MSNVDGLLERLKCIAACESCKRGVGRAMNATDVLDIIATIEQQRAELSAKDRRIEIMEAKLDAWHDLYGSEDWRSVLAAEMEEDP